MLAKLLEEAKEKHAEYEKALGKSDEGWAYWYAYYILEQINPSDSDEESP